MRPSTLDGESRAHRDDRGMLILATEFLAARRIGRSEIHVIVCRNLRAIRVVDRSSLGSVHLAASDRHSSGRSRTRSDSSRHSGCEASDLDLESSSKRPACSPVYVGGNDKWARPTTRAETWWATIRPSCTTKTSHSDSYRPERMRETIELRYCHRTSAALRPFTDPDKTPQSIPSVESPSGDSGPLSRPPSLATRRIPCGARYATFLPRGDRPRGGTEGRMTPTQLISPPQGSGQGPPGPSPCSRGSRGTWCSPRESP